MYLVGVRVALPPNEVDLYALVLYSEAERDHHNRPLTFNGKIVFFRDIAHATQVLALGDAGFRKHATAPSELSSLYEPLKALALVEHGDYDDAATIVNCGNELLDFVAATGRTIPAQHRVSLEMLLNYATFDRDLSVYFDKADGGRRAALDVLLWCFGAVWAGSIILEDSRPGWC
ncbi:MAG: hypothetical protein M3Y05_13795 [Gemmatimonadota bacterium]|nr:hypothetical protein [Gemmatimonadota bacterium]